MDVAWWLVAALAAPLRIEVLPDPPPAPRERPAWTRPEPLPVGEGRVLVDGRLDDPPWTVQATGLLPWDVGPTPPASLLRVVRAPDGLAFAMQGVPDGLVATLVVDPNGLGQAWWKVVIEGGVAATWRCTLLDDPAPPEWPVPEKAVPCQRAEPVPVAVSGADAEVLLPWSVLGPATSRLRALWALTGPKHSGGTLAVSGAQGLVPSLGRLLDVAQPAGRIGVVTDVEHGVWRLTVPAVRRGAGAEWSWSRWRSGRMLDEGTLTVGSEEVVVTLPDLGMDAVQVQVRHGDAPLGPAWVTGVRRRQNVVSLGTPVFADHLEWAFDLPDPRAVEVVVRGAAGEIGRGTAELPGGTGRLRVYTDPAWGPVGLEVVGMWTGTAVPAP